MLLALRVDPGFDRIPVVAVSRYSDEKHSLLDLGFSGVIDKPIPAAFVTQVEGFLA